MKTLSEWKSFLKTNPCMNSRFVKAQEECPNLINKDLNQLPVPPLDLIFEAVSRASSDPNFDPYDPFEALLHEDPMRRMRALSEVNMRMDHIYTLVHKTRCRGCLARGNFEYIWQILKHYCPDHDIEWPDIEYKEFSLSDYVRDVAKTLNSRMCYGVDCMDSMSENYGREGKTQLLPHVLDEG
jgi:hypothetical protein